MSGSGDGKSNGLPVDPMQRLASFKPPRDLSLGGIKPNKKVFTPNLNVTRNKSKGPTPNTNRDSKREDRNKKDRKNDRNRNLKSGQYVIKSGAVFSEGLGSSERHSSRVSYGRDTESAPTLQKPTLRLKEFVKVDKEQEEKKIRSVFGDSGYLDQETREEAFDDANAPVRLPLDRGTWSAPKPALRIKQEVKSEPLDGVESILLHEEIKPVDVRESLDNTDVVDLLRSDKATLILLQLPDTLPGQGRSSDDDMPRRKNTSSEPSTSNGDSEEQKPIDNRCRLEDLEEGRIGKLLVHRSGRVTLALGDTVFEVSAGTKVAFHQEAVSIGVDEASRSANMIALGPLKHKLNVLPDWEEMFRKMPV